MAAIDSTETTTETRFLRMSEVLSKTGIRSRSTVYEMMKAGSFPRCVFITGKSIAFVQKEIEEWMRARIGARPTPSVISTAPAPRPRGRRRGPARPRAARPVIG